MNQEEYLHIRTLKKLKALYELERKNPFVYTGGDKDTISITGAINFLLQRGDISMSEYMEIISDKKRSRKKLNS